MNACMHVSMHARACVYVCTDTYCMYVCEYIYVSCVRMCDAYVNGTYTHTHACMHVQCMYTSCIYYMYACMYLCIHVHIYVCIMYVCVCYCACMRAYVYICKLRLV